MVTIATRLLKLANIVNGYSLNTAYLNNVVRNREMQLNTQARYTKVGF